VNLGYDKSMVTANFFIASEIDYSIIKRLYRLNLVKAKFIKVNFFIQDLLCIKH